MLANVISSRTYCEFQICGYSFKSKLVSSFEYSIVLVLFGSFLFLFFHFLISLCVFIDIFIIDVISHDFYQLN